MKNHQLNLLKLAVYLSIVIILTAIIFIVSHSNFSPGVYGKKESKDYIENISLSIISSNWTFAYQNKSTSNVTVADFLFEYAKNNNFNIEKEFWEGYDSFFIVEINNIENGEEGKYWQYYINGEFADVGCSKYYLNDNDIVEWRFERPRW